MSNLIPYENTIRLPIGMDFSIEGIESPYRRKFKLLDESIMDALVLGIGITRINPVDFYEGRA